MIKKCTDCKQSKDLSEFYKNRARYDGIENRCKECTKVRNKEYRGENKDYLKDYKAKYYQANKERENARYKRNKINAMKNAKSDLNYDQLHSLIKRLKPIPERCDICHQWKKLELASIGHTYTEDPFDWKYLCRTCHIEFDQTKPSLPITIETFPTDGIDVERIRVVLKESEEFKLRWMAKRILKIYKKVLEVEVL